MCDWNVKGLLTSCCHLWIFVGETSRGLADKVNDKLLHILVINLPDFVPMYKTWHPSSPFKLSTSITTISSKVITSNFPFTIFFARGNWMWKFPAYSLFVRQFLIGDWFVILLLCDQLQSVSLNSPLKFWRTSFISNKHTTFPLFPLTDKEKAA